MYLYFSCNFQNGIKADILMKFLLLFHIQCYSSVPRPVCAMPGCLRFSKFSNSPRSPYFIFSRFCGQDVPLRQRLNQLIMYIFFIFRLKLLFPSFCSGSVVLSFTFDLNLWQPVADPCLFRDMQIRQTLLAYLLFLLVKLYDQERKLNKVNNQTGFLNC